MVKVPLRCAPVVLAAMEKVTVPFPVPLAPEVIVIQFALLTAAQGQIPLEAFTFTLFVVAAAFTVVLLADSEYEQTTLAWLTVYVRPAIVSVPLRGVRLLFASIEKLTLPLPVPPAPDVMVIQLTLLTAVQGQTALEALTFTFRVVAAAEIEAL